MEQQTQWVRDIRELPPENGWRMFEHDGPAYQVTDHERDPRWEWVEAGTHGNPDQVIRGRCRHLTPVLVHAKGTGELVARLCPDCDTQLPAED